MKEINAEPKPIKSLFYGSRYGVDSYQREYKWATKQIEDLATDLYSAFGDDYTTGDSPGSVKKYGSYFLGPIIVDASGNKPHIVDGQQRLTTISLVLIHLYRLVENESLRTKLRDLAYPDSFDVRSFVPDVKERSACLLHFLNGGEEDFDDNGQSESVCNLVARFKDVQDKLMSQLNGEQIPVFASWFIEKVHLVEITASTSEDAYKIFETMNDRGLRLAPAEMLKGYLLSKIQNDALRTQSNESWKEQTDELTHQNEEVADAIKVWLRAKHAKEQSDFEKIGAEFHRWVREKEYAIGLKGDSDIANFIVRDFRFYAKSYSLVRNAADNYSEASGLERIYYLAQHSFTLQYPLLLASLSPDDSPVEITCKLRVIAAYLDIMVHRRIGHGESIAESRMRSRIFGLIPEIRAMNAQQIASHLFKKLETDEAGPTFASDFGMHQQNRPRIHRILARITDYVERQSNTTSQYPQYFTAGKKSYQIEHIWHADYESVCTEEDMVGNMSEGEFWTMRNYIGGLLLLLSKDNASYGDIPYTTKRDYYLESTSLAASLHEATHRAGFRQFKKNSDLPFEPHSKFQKFHLEQRQTLYRAIADKIWDPQILHDEANANAD